MLGVTSAFVNTYFLADDENSRTLRAAFHKIMTGEDTMSCKDIIREIRALRGWRDSNRVGDDHLDGQIDVDFYTLADVVDGDNEEAKVSYLRRITEAEERLVFGLSAQEGNQQAETDKGSGTSFANYLSQVLDGLLTTDEPRQPLLGSLIDTQKVDAGSSGVYQTAALLLMIKDKLDSIGDVVEADTARDILLQIRELLK